MSTIVYRGDAQSQSAQVTTLTVGGTPAAGNTLTVTINRKAVTITAGSLDTTATLAAALQTALASITDAEFAEVSWAYAGSGSVVTGTAQTAEVPFTATASATGGGATLTASTAGGVTGPSHLEDVNNSSSGSLPVNSDTLVFPDQNLNCFYGLTALSSVSLTELRIEGGTIGLPERNTNGYSEYRTKDLTLAGCTSLNIRGSNVTRARIKITSGSTTADISASGGFSTAGTAEPAIRLTGAGTYAAVNVEGGDVGISFSVGETTTVSALKIGAVPVANSIGSKESASRVRIGSGATITAASLYSGSVETMAAGTNLTIAGGIWKQVSGNLGTITSTGGTVDFRSTGSIGNATFVGPDAVLDLSGANGAVTCGSLSFTGGAALIDPQKRISSLSVYFDADSLAASNLGQTLTVARS